MTRPVTTADIVRTGLHSAIAIYGMYVAFTDNIDTGLLIIILAVALSIEAQTR